MTLKIVTDSTCDLPNDITSMLGITVVPCNIHFGTETFRDGVDISREDFYRRLNKDLRHPTTSQPPVGTFLDTYKKVAHEADEILSLHISSKLSGTYGSAVQATKEFDNSAKVEAFDSLTVSLGLGLLVREVAIIAQRGGTLDEALAWLETTRNQSEVYVSVDTLKYLIRGGRASRLQGFFGGVLDIKPIIQVRDGETHPVDRVRSRNRLYQRFTEIAASKGPNVSLGLIYSADSAGIDPIVKTCAEWIPREQIIISEFSAVMGTHLGPRALGVAILPKEL